MAITKRFRGPKLSVKLSILGIVLLAIPWLSYHQLIEMERLLFQGQQNAQLLMARGVALLFNERDELFFDLPIQLTDYESLYALPLYETVRIDGDMTDWDERVRSNQQEYRNIGGVDASFELTLGEQVNQLYVFLSIKDDTAVYRDLSELQLSTADHVRMQYTSTSGETARVLLGFSGPGAVTSYLMDSNWREPLDWTPLKEVVGYVDRTVDSYSLEFRVPITNFTDGRDFSISFVDVDDSVSRLQRSTTTTQANDPRKKLNLVVLRSTDAMALIDGLGYDDARIVVYDQHKRVRGESKQVLERDESNPVHSGLLDVFGLVRPYLHFLTMGERWLEISFEESTQRTRAAVEDALQGNPTAVRRITETGMPVVMAAYPIFSQNEVIGALTIDADVEQIMSFQQAALRQIVLVSVITLFFVLFVAIGFSARLAHRIRRLRREAAGAIDQFGRLSSTALSAEVQAGDEIGDLARAIDAMLSRLKEHNAFLQRMPRTLRHEINNPLNTLATSLESLDQAATDIERQQCIDSARRGVQRISSIVQNLADASNLEEALQREEKGPIDIQALLSSYVANLNHGRAKPLFVFRGEMSPVFVLGADVYLEQMLDKIIDNAVDFHHTDSRIRVQLEAGNDQIRITVGNRGPSLGENAHLLFERLVSRRKGASSTHFGLGLYVVRVIAEYHGGSVAAFNLHDQSGVLISVQLPRYQPELARAA